MKRLIASWPARSYPSSRSRTDTSATSSDWSTRTGTQPRFASFSVIPTLTKSGQVIREPRSSGRRHITLTFSPFVPKSHTPFQWERQDDFDETRKKLAWIKARLKGQGVEIRHHQTADTAIEGLISRGGREIAEVIHGAWRCGARFDGWGEHCRLSHWTDALADQGLTLGDTFREIGEDEELPWEIVSFKIDRDYFLKERHKAYAAGETVECKDVRCSACGVCDFDSLKNVLAEPGDTAAPSDPPSMLQGVPATTVRLRYHKGEAVRFISHLDLLRELERTLRRAEVPMVFSEGFSPRPRLSAGPPLALGWTSDAEWLDSDLADGWTETELNDLLHDLNARVAPGIRFSIAAAMPPRTTSLAAGITTSVYEAHFPSPTFATDYGRLHAATETLLAAGSVVIRRQRKGRARDIDIRPLVYDLSVLSSDTVAMTVATGSQGSVKPTEVLQAALDLDEVIVPLIQVHKLVATTTTGDTPDAHSECRAEVATLETRNPHIWEPARDARGDPGGRSPC